MWPFSNNAYLSIVDAKRAERERAISTAAPSVASEHSVYLNATGGSFDAFTLLGKLMYFQLLKLYQTLSMGNGRLRRCWKLLSLGLRMHRPPLIA